MSVTDDRLDGIKAVLYQRIDAYHSIEPGGVLAGRILWLYCARSAAAARLVAESWARVADGVPAGLLAQAATTATLFYDAERARWRSRARDVAAELEVAR